MVTAAVMSALHLLALALGLPSVVLRGAALRGALDASAVRRVLLADTFWGIAALLWITTGLLRAFGGLEKGSDFYLASPLFWTKMGLLGAVLLLELWPMVTFIGWRIALAKRRSPDTRRARALYAVTLLQTALVLAMVFTASFMSRGFGLQDRP